MPEDRSIEAFIADNNNLHAQLKEAEARLIEVERKLQEYLATHACPNSADQSHE